MGTEHGEEGRALVPSSGDGDKPSFTAEDLAHIESSSAGAETTVPAKRSEAEARLAEIRALRKTDQKKYYSNEIQGEELALLQAIQKAEVQADDDAPGLPAELLESWSRQGGVEYHLQKARSTVQAMLDGMQPDEQAPFMAAFDGLPEEVTTAVYAYLAVDGGGFGQANDADLEIFKSTAAGAELVDEWGRKAPRHVGTIKGRLGMMRRSMGEANWKTADAWLDGLSPSQEKAVWMALVR